MRKLAGARTKKTVLERKAPPTFTVMIEILERDRLAVHDNLGEVVDLFLRGAPLSPEIRTRSADGQVEITKAEPEQAKRVRLPETAEAGSVRKRHRRRTVRIFSYGVSRLRLERIIQKLRVPATIVHEIEKADLILTLKSQEKRQPRDIRDAEARGIPRHVLKSNTAVQMENFLRSLFTPDEFADEEETAALIEAQAAMENVLEHGLSVELLPRNSHIRRLQHMLAERYGLKNRKRGQRTQPARRGPSGLE